MARILVITPSYSPRLGGVEKHVWHTSQQLKDRGWQVDILTQGFDSLPAKEVKAGLKIHRFFFPPLRFIGLLIIWWRLVSRYWQLVNRADVVHVHDVFIWYLPLKLIFYSKPVVLTFHGWEGIYPVPWKNILIRKLGAWLADKTVAIGKYVEKYYRLITDQVLYGAVDTPKKLPKKEKLLLYVGRLDYDTGLPMLLQALRASEWSGKVVFCGDGLLREQAELVGEVKGFVDPRPYLKKAKVVFAGGYLSILEAFAYRCAVIAAEKNPLKKDYYLLAPFASWIYLASSIDEVERHLQRLMNGSKLVKHSVDQAYDWTKQQTWSALTDHYESLYQQVL
jgi:glycosyltransferase involved in cell wall biosynthesis